MKKYRYILGLLFLLISISSYAGMWAFTTHSRANCINNESISWQAKESRTLRTYSSHERNGNVHVVDTGWEYTWRSAAVHFGEAPPRSGYTVWGDHWIWFPGEPNPAYIIPKTVAYDCSIYDGWWD